MMFEGYLERGFIAEDGDLETLTKLLGMLLGDMKISPERPS
jgi:hypothetical protein